MTKISEIKVIDARNYSKTLHHTFPEDSSVIAIIKSNELREKWFISIYPELTPGELTEKINQLAKSHRVEFEIALEELASTKSVYWRATRTAEKNTLINPLFENVILAFLVLEHNFRHTSRILITDNPFLLSFFKNQKIFERIKNNSLSKLKYSWRNIKNLFLFLIWFIGNLIVAKQTPQKESQILIHTFIDEGSRRGQIYKERFFPGLSDWYEKNNLSVSYLLSGGGNYPLRLFKAMNAHGHNVFNEFKLYKPKDLVFVVVTASKLRRTEINSFSIRDFELKKLIIHIHSEFGIDLDVYKHILRSKLGKRLGKIANPPNVLLTEFEGMIPEKMLNLGISSSNSKIKTFGFQHGAMFEHLLCNYPTSSELRLGLVSDKIISNGSIFKDLMISRGLPSDRIVTGSALRYRYLHESIKTESPVGQKDLLVLLPMTIPDCVELIRMVQEGVSKLNTTVHFKPHPFNDISFLSHHIDLSRHTIVDNMLGNLIFDYKVIAGMTTGALLEAGLLGLNVIKIQRHLSIDFDTTFLNPELRIQVRDSEEFRNALIDLQENRSGIIQKNDKNLVESYFAPISLSGMAAFLP
jgi:hypothetical protein